jgi:hypothetical protein
MPSDCARAWVASLSLRSLARVQTAAAKVTTALRFSAVIGNFPRAGATSDNGVHGLSKLGSQTFFRWRVEQDVVLTVTVARGRLGALGSLSQSTRWPSRFARSFNSSSSGSGALARDIPREGSEQQRDVFVLGGKWYCLEVSAAVLSAFL